jgi:uncharacterized glyoxalase superfamily protein PhnB
MVKKLTPVLIVEEVERCAKFWVERLGFTQFASVPEGDRMAFVMLQQGTTEVMYQSLSSALKDTAEAAGAAANWVHTHPATIYVEVDDLDGTIAALAGVKVAMPLRTTFYGAKEYGVWDPGGHFVIFAEMIKAAA